MKAEAVFGTGQLCCYQGPTILTVTLLVNLEEFMQGFSLGIWLLICIPWIAHDPVGLKMECLLWVHMLNPSQLCFGRFWKEAGAGGRGAPEGSRLLRKCL